MGKQVSSWNNKTEFSSRLLIWHLTVNSRSLPWIDEPDPYKIWLSEVMLQQTRSGQGLPYYLKFIAAYPSVFDLASAKDDEVFRLWQGLGYYARCRNMLATARHIAYEKDGIFPDSYEALIQLKGVGAYTAAAIASFGFGLPHAVVDGNVYRVLARYFGIFASVDTTEGKKVFQALADDLLHDNDPGAFNQAIMDFGATVCTPAKPACDRCPVSERCIAFQESIIDALPLKRKKPQVKTRYFHYFFFRNDGRIWIRLRATKDIWKGLYEPYLIESDQRLSIESISADPLIARANGRILPAGTGAFSQRLTHQIIHSLFFEIALSEISEMPDGGRWVLISDLKQLPFPKTLADFFEKNGYF